MSFFDRIFPKQLSPEQERMRQQEAERSRLRVGAYRPNDRVGMFDESGEWQPYWIQSIEGTGIDRQIELVEGPRSNAIPAETAKVVHPAELDRFFRGRRTDLSFLLAGVQKDLLLRTRFFPGTMEESVAQVAEEMARVQKPMAGFYFHNDYDALFHALRTLEQEQKPRFTDAPTLFVAPAARLTDVRSVEDARRLIASLQSSNAVAPTKNPGVVLREQKYGKQHSAVVDSLIQLVVVYAQERLNAAVK